MHEWACCCDEAADHQLPIAAAFWIIWIVSTEECSSIMQNLMQIPYSSCSVILNVRATQYTCSLEGIHCPHWPVRWSRHCSLMHIPVHSPWLPGSLNVEQTILVILTMAGHFPDRPCICTMEYYSALRRKGILTCPTIMDEPWRHYARWNKPVTKEKCYVIPLVGGSRVVEFIETESRTVVVRSWGRRNGGVVSA